MGLWSLDPVLDESAAGSLFPVGVRSGGQRCKNPVLGSHIPDLNALAFAAVISYLHSATLCSALPHTSASTYNIYLIYLCVYLARTSDRLLFSCCSEHWLLRLRYLCIPMLQFQEKQADIYTNFGAVLLPWYLNVKRSPLVREYYSHCY